MRYPLLLNSSLVLLALLGSGQTQAQSLAAGQTIGVVYTDVVPDKVLDGNVTEALDLDNDGRADLLMTSYNSGGYPSLVEARVKMLHEDVNLRTISNDWLLPKFEIGELIQDKMPAKANPSYYDGYELWTSPSTVVSYLNTFFTSVRFNPAGMQAFGFWLDKQDHFLAMRLRSSSAAAWRYGWMRIQVTATNAPYLVIKDFALTNTVLASQSAAAAGWQIYPTCVTSHLTLVAPTTAPVQLTLRDLCGRTHLRRTLTAASSTLDLTALATGLYVLELETPIGRICQRISKY